MATHCDATAMLVLAGALAATRVCGPPVVPVVNLNLNLNLNLNQLNSVLQVQGGLLKTWSSTDGRVEG